MYLFYALNQKQLNKPLVPTVFQWCFPFGVKILFMDNRIIKNNGFMVDYTFGK
jgi:hypothetical protein